MVQTEEFNLIVDRFEGLYTAKDSDQIPFAKSPIMLNMRVGGSHVRGAEGYSLIGTRDATAGKILSQYTYKRNDGDEVMVRVKDNSTNTILEWYDATNDEFYTLLGGLTTGKKMGFAEFNTSTANNMIFCNGVENLSTWTGAITRLTSAVSASDTTINVSSTADFPATGTIIYNGTEIAYTGKTATTFTVGSAHASAGADDGVAEAVDDATHSALTKGNILLSAKDRLWIAGQPDNPSGLDYSDEGDAFTFTGGANRANSGAEDFFGIGGKITGLAEKDEEIIVFGEDGADGFSFIYPTSTTKAPNFREIFRGESVGCLNHESIFKIQNEVYFANKNGIQAVSDLQGSEKVFNKSITRDILPTLKDFVFTEASSIYYDKESILLIACKSDEDFTANDTVIGIEFFKNKNESDTFGITLFDWIVNSWAILNDKLYIGSSLEMNSFQGFDSYQNDGAPRTISYATKRFNGDDPFQRKESRFIGVRGMIKDGTDIDVDILLNSGFLATLSKTIESTGSYVSQNSYNTIGAFALGINPIGTKLDDIDELKEFTVILDIGTDYSWRDIELILSSDTDGGTFLITHIGFAAEGTGYSAQQVEII
jgi:hypothetical protein